MAIRRLPAELCDIVRRAAHYPHGLGFLHQGFVDSVAVTLGVHPFAIDATRAYMETRKGRAELIEAVRRERDRRLARPLPHTPTRRTLHDCEERARRLIETAREDPRGLVFLTDGPPEEVAAAFHVHPYLVFRARGLLERHPVTEGQRTLATRDQGPGPP